jgi:serine/threonine protein kinase
VELVERLDMNTIKLCPGCQKPLPDGAPDGLCPECLMKAGLGTDVEIGQESHGESGQQPPATPSPETISPHFPHLEILELLGHGGMGTVYKARQPHLNRLVALKILAPNKGQEPAFAERFTREAQTLARLNHPNIVTLYDFGKVEGMYYLLMEYVDGVSLRQLLQSKKLDPEEALAIVPKICEALQHAHEHGVVHRDIKPENVLLNQEGRVKIADFGIAKIIEVGAGQPTITQEQQVIGTPRYMAPEQVEHPKQVDHRADIYSLGVVFYEMLTGELPLGKFAPPSYKVHVDVRLDEVVLKALEKEPERRYQQANQVKTDVERITSATSQPKTRSSSVFTRWKVALGAIGVVALVALGLALGLSRVLNLSLGQKRIPTKYESAPVRKGPLTMSVVASGSLTPSARVAAQWQVDVNVPETIVADIEVGQEVECQADAFRGRVFKGKVTSLADTPEPGAEDVKYAAVVQVTDNQELRFRPGMSVIVEFIMARRTNALLIPSHALWYRPPEEPTDSTPRAFGLSPRELAMADADERAARTVWVIGEKNEPEPVQIRIGITDGTSTEVVAGLKEGDRVVVDEVRTGRGTQAK